MVVIVSPRTGPYIPKLKENQYGVHEAMRVTSTKEDQGCRRDKFINSFFLPLSAYCPYRRSMDFENYTGLSQIETDGRENYTGRANTQFHPLILLEFINLDRNITMYRLMNQTIYKNSEESQFIYISEAPKCFPLSCCCQNKIFKKRRPLHDSVRPSASR